MLSSSVSLALPHIIVMVPISLPNTLQMLQIYLVVTPGIAMIPDVYDTLMLKLDYKHDEQSQSPHYY